MANTADAQTTTFEPGQMLFGEGAAADRVFIINSGHVRITKRVFRESVLIETLGRGNVCGDIAFAAGALYPVTATAVDTVEAIVVQRDDLEAVMLGNPKVVARLASRLAARLTHAHHRLAGFVLRDTMGRVMHQLRQEAARDGALDGTGFAPIPYDLPDALAAERGEVDHCLRTLVTDGLIELDGGGRFRMTDISAFDRRLTYLELRDRMERG